MTLAAAAYLIDAWVSLCAALGALMVLGRLSALSLPDSVESRFRFVLWLVMVFMAARIGHWGGWGWLFSAVTNATAALLPLSALLLSEALMRRHGPRPLKALCAGGGVVFVLWGVLLIAALEPLRIGGMLVFQLVALSGVALFSMRRDRDSLATEENRAIDRMALTFALILPFLVTDYLRDGPVDLPVRMGGLAVLALCWIAIGANRSGVSRADIVRNFLILAAVCAALGGIIAALGALDARATTQVCVALLAAIMLLAIWQASVALSLESPHLTALRQIAEAQGTGAQAALSFVQRAAGAPDSLLVQEHELQDVDLAALRQRLSADPLAKAGAEADEHIAWLLERFGASHVMALSTAPLRLVLLGRPAIAAADHSDSGLRAIQRWAATMTDARGRDDD